MTLHIQYAEIEEEFMLLSVIVPIYNVEPYLVKCINSIVNQNTNNYELILIDDHSTDDSLSIAKQFEHNCRVKIIAKGTNSGLSDTRNIGLKHSTGDYIVFLDSDDYIEDGALENIQYIISNNNYPDIVYFGFYEEVNGLIHKKYGYKSKVNQLYNGVEFIKNELSQRNLYAAACFGVYKRDFLIANNIIFKAGIFHEDELWTPQVVLAAKTIYTSEYVYYHYVRRKNSITRKDDKTKNGIDLLNIAKELDSLFTRTNDSRLNKLMNNHIAMLYMKGMSEGKLFRKETKKNIDRFFPLKKTCFVKDRAKAILFAVSLKYYYILNETQEK